MSEDNKKDVEAKESVDFIRAKIMADAPTSTLQSAYVPRVHRNPPRPSRPAFSSSAQTIRRPSWGKSET